MEAEGPCEKHPEQKLSLFCEACKSLLCSDCKTGHDNKHTIFTLKDLGDKLIQLLSKEDDTALYQEICKMEEELNGEVSKLKRWFDEIERKVVEGVRQCMSDIMNEVLEQTNEKLGKKRAQMEEALKMNAETRETIISELRDLSISEQYKGVMKYKDMYYQCLEKEKLFTTTASSKLMWVQHIKKMKGISLEYLKDTVSKSLTHIFYVPLIYIIPNKSNLIVVYDPVSKKRTISTMDGLLKARHFDSVLIKNSVYISGGNDEESKSLLRDLYEYELLENGNQLHKKADMLKGRFGHKMINVIESFIYCLGGIITSFLGTKYTNHCEKYDRVYDRWVEVKPLHENKGYMSACHFRERFIYVFGGFNDDVASESSSSVEFFDTMIESEGWKLVKIANVQKKWQPISQAGVVQLGKQRLLLFGGRSHKSTFSADCFLYDIKDNTMKQLECKLAHPTSFYQRTIVSFKDELYAFDATDNNLHIFDPVAIKWRHVKRLEWDVN